MAITVLTRKILWGNSGNRCNFPGCNCNLDLVSGSSHTIVGEECHIEAQSKGGPRYNPSLTETQINDQSNLILLCSVHHKLIDSNPEEYTVDCLKMMKANHEKRVRSSLDFDAKRLDADIYYASIIDYINMMLEFDNWDNWTSFALSSSNIIVAKQIMDSIEEISRYIFGRVWPNRYGDLESAIKNFGQLLTDYLVTFHEHSVQKGEYYQVEKFYHIKPYDHVLADELLEEYKEYTRVLHNLILEMTRAANHICDLVRIYIDATYRLAEGALLVTTGPLRDLSYGTFRPEYRDNEKTSTPYPGLSKFKQIMLSRDISL